jgi:cytochrome c oxidase cbb3-type subunit III
MGRRPCAKLAAALLVLVAAIAIGRGARAGGQEGVQQTPYQNMTPEQRAAATRAFLGLGAEPDKAAAARGAPIYQQNCAFCHGPQARGATGPSLITSDEVLGDDHGEHLLPFLKKGRPEKGMPAFASTSDDQLRDVSEFLHLQVEEIANRGAYRVLDILVGDASKGHEYVEAHCMSCHTEQTFAHIAGRFRTTDQLQRGWIWPSRSGSSSTAPTATVKMSDGAAFTGRVTQISDFRITLVDQGGQTHAVDLRPDDKVELNDPLAPHEKMIETLKNSEMHDVTAYLESLK